MIRKIANDSAHGVGQFADQCRRGQDLFALRRLGIEQYIDNLHLVTSTQLLSTDLLQVRQGSP